MEWRCEWCGKPHAEDDPPCDNCGHGTFEKAVVQEPAAVANESTTVWVCTGCGREHAKHAPPCSRCGNATLERREITVDDAELTSPGYRDLLTPRYVLGFAVVLGLAAVLLLGIAGVIDLPGMDDSGVPEVEDVPGSADTYEGTSLAAVESAYVERFNELQSERGNVTLDRDERLDEVARYFNQRRVKADFGSGSLPEDDRVIDLLGDTCGSNVGVAPTELPPPESATSAEELGASLAEMQFARGTGEVPATNGITGVDVHATTADTLYVTQFTC